MKSPRNAGLLLWLALMVMVSATWLAPRGGGQALAFANAPGSAGFEIATPVAVSRKACRFGQRYSPYYRRCVLWTPFDLT